MKKILVVDDNCHQQVILSEILKTGGYDIRLSDYSRDAIRKISSESFDVALLDVVMPGLSGMDVLAEFRRLSPATRVIVMSAYPSVDVAVNAMKRGANDFISKPVSPSDLLAKVGALIEEASFEKRTDGLDLNLVLDAIANPSRRKILKLLFSKTSLRVSDLSKDLAFNDHTKVLFHLRPLKKSGLIEQEDKDRSYLLTPVGKRAAECLKIFENCFLK